MFTGSSASYDAEYPHAKGAAHPAKVRSAKQVTISSDSCCVLAVDSGLNLVYVSRGADPAGSNTTLLNGTSLSVVATVSGFGGNNNVDPKTHYAWLPGLFAGMWKCIPARRTLRLHSSHWVIARSIAG